jgi:hypothetical protein
MDRNSLYLHNEVWQDVVHDRIQAGLEASAREHDLCQMEYRPMQCQIGAAIRNLGDWLVETGEHLERSGQPAKPISQPDLSYEQGQ